MQWMEAKRIDLLGVGVSQGVLIAAQWRSFGPSSWLLGVWAIDPESGGIRWTSHYATRWPRILRWWDRKTGWLARWRDGALGVHDGEVICASGRVLDVMTGQERTSGPSPELVNISVGRRKALREWTDDDRRIVVPGVAILKADADWLQQVRRWLGESAGASEHPTPEALASMQVPSSWKDGAGEIQRSKENYVLGSVGVRVVPTAPDAWRGESRCALEVAEIRAGRVLAHRPLRTPAGVIQVRVVPHPRGVLVLIASGVGRHQALSTEWYAWDWSRPPEQVPGQTLS
jgi:hypothetical protein